ncbi:unnamed protein product [Prunus armeniaca]
MTKFFLYKKLVADVIVDISKPRIEVKLVWPADWPSFVGPISSTNPKKVDDILNSYSRPRPCRLAQFRGSHSLPWQVRPGGSTSLDLGPVLPGLQSIAGTARAGTALIPAPINSGQL